MGRNDGRALAAGKSQKYVGFKIHLSIYDDYLRHILVFIFLSFRIKVYKIDYVIYIFIYITMKNPTFGKLVIFVFREQI